MAIADSGVHPITMEKSALAGEGGVCTPTPFTLLPSRTKMKCTLLLRGQIHSFYFVSTTLYVLCGIDDGRLGIVICIVLVISKQKVSTSFLIT